MVRVRMDGYVLPVVNEMTGMVSSSFFVPLEKDFADAAAWDVDHDSLDEIVLSIQSYGPRLSETERRKYEINWQERFTTTFLQELREEKSRRFRGMSHFFDAAASASFAAGAGALSIDHSSSLTATGEVFGALQLALITGVFALQGAKAFRDARTRQYAGTIADHFSTNLSIEYGNDKGLHAKVLALHEHFDAICGPSRKINTAMAQRAQELDLPAVQKFYEKRVDPKKVQGVVFKLFDKGFLKSIADGFRAWYTNDSHKLSVVEQIGRQVGCASPQERVRVNIPVTLLPSFDGYDVFVGHRDYQDLSDLATRIGQEIDVGIAFEVYTPRDLDERQRAVLERDLPLAIHDNVYRMSRISNVIPRKAIETGSRVGRYMGICFGGLMTAGGISAVATGNPIAGAAIIATGAYLVARQFVFSKPLERASKEPYERLIRGYDNLQERLLTTNVFSYRTDQSLRVFDTAMAEHSSPYSAYVACVHQAKQLDCPDLAAHYIKKAVSVQPIEHEERSGVMELERGRP